MLRKIGFVTLTVILAAPMVCLAAGPQAFLTESVYEFAPVVEGTKVEHAFVIQNHGDAPLLILDLKSG